MESVKSQEDIKNLKKNRVVGRDHVWIGHLAYISRGVTIGSGSIIDNYSFIPHNAKIYSNTLVMGNPSRIGKKCFLY